MSTQREPQPDEGRRGRMIAIAPATVTTAQALREAVRELNTRRNIYPRWVEQGRMSEKLAAHRIACMAAIVTRLRRDLDQEKNPDLFGGRLR